MGGATPFSRRSWNIPEFILRYQILSFDTSWSFETAKIQTQTQKNFLSLVFSVARIQILKPPDLKATAMVQWVKLLLTSYQSSNWNPSFFTSVSASCWYAWKAEDNPSTQIPESMWETQMELEAPDINMVQPQPL